MEQHRLNSLAIICIERTYGNQVIVNSIDKMTDIFGQRHGRKNFFFQHVLDGIETVDRIKYANFQLSYFSNDSRFISWEMANVCVYILISTTTHLGISYRPQVRRCPYAYV